MKIAIINYGMCNLSSVRRAFEDLGAKVFVADHPTSLYEANRIILPGVGAFSEGMTRLVEDGWVDALHDLVILQQKPLLGICLGMQMLATSGEEGGVTKGLNLIPGKVMRLDQLGCDLRIPHVGWNEVHYLSQDDLFTFIPDSSDFYFVHSYAFVPDSQENIIATATYGTNITAVVRNNHIFGCQFHPEKSSKAGRQLLKNFMNFMPC
ncbi:imidazole glycerol phosphate synthase subunit HisH [Methylophaga muralis]|uniref:Imidazole glycerol phosphate synthase subunit HisH n=1 Tax=Methylophaga muralis TaxID=291169 RepID=A0A1E3GN74_9GAMM|nr:imidazole glycerol phosphate synthase subunit HisH [Methylophaga muralis]ODN65484.1 Imidazole glycerol phosphate synthase subunit HisH 1 [Methylophaga muralis]